MFFIQIIKASPPAFGLQTTSKNTNLPILVGFGVSSRTHIETISGFADGVVVGAALLDSISNAKKGNTVLEASKFIKSLRGN